MEKIGTTTAQASGPITTGDQRPSLAAHTPGPWRLVETAGRFDTRVNGYLIKYGPVGNWLAHVEACGNAALDNEANARLIAAAPDMLEALRDALGTLYEMWPINLVSQFNDDPGVVKIRAAIARATGAEP